MRPGSANGERGTVEEPCSPGNPNQEWSFKRSGNTFELISYFGQCLGVHGQSRADGAKVLEQACTGASNQLWSVESLRQDDYETLYQEDRDREDWLPTATDAYPNAVEVDNGKPICRALNESLLGIVQGQQCVGKTYAGQPAASPMYQRLYQAP